MFSFIKHWYIGRLVPREDLGYSITSGRIERTYSMERRYHWSAKAARAFVGFCGKHINTLIGISSIAVAILTLL